MKNNHRLGPEQRMKSYFFSVYKMRLGLVMGLSALTLPGCFLLVDTDQWSQETTCTPSIALDSFDPHLDQENQVRVMFTQAGSAPLLRALAVMNELPSSGTTVRFDDVEFLQGRDTEFHFFADLDRDGSLSSIPLDHQWIQEFSCASNEVESFTHEFEFDELPIASDRAGGSGRPVFTPQTADFGASLRGFPPVLRVEVRVLEERQPQDPRIRDLTPTQQYTVGVYHFSNFRDVALNEPNDEPNVNVWIPGILDTGGPIEIQIWVDTNDNGSFDDTDDRAAILAGKNSVFSWNRGVDRISADGTDPTGAGQRYLSASAEGTFSTAVINYADDVEGR
ncbi:MAG: hypothetical protein AAF550_11830, partial [Myxococcota bacterium]